MRDSEARVAFPNPLAPPNPATSVSNNSTEAASRAKTAGGVSFKSFAVSFRRRGDRFSIGRKCESRLNDSIVHVETKHALTNHRLQKIVFVVCDRRAIACEIVCFFVFVRLPEDAGAVDGPPAGARLQHC